MTSGKVTGAQASELHGAHLRMQLLEEDASGSLVSSLDDSGAGVRGAPSTPTEMQDSAFSLGDDQRQRASQISCWQISFVDRWYGASNKVSKAIHAPGYEGMNVSEPSKGRAAPCACGGSICQLASCSARRHTLNPERPR